MEMMCIYPIVATQQMFGQFKLPDPVGLTGSAGPGLPGCIRKGGATWFPEMTGATGSAIPVTWIKYKRYN